MKVSVDVDWLKDNLRSKSLTILDARSRRAYVAGHLPRARHADLFHYFVPGTDKKGLKRFQEDLVKRLGKLGLTGKETVVVYESRLGMRAARAAWMLEYAGSHRVLLLEGGFQAWRKSRFPVEKKLTRPEVKIFRLRPNSKLLATAEDVAGLESGVILDVRSELEFTGKEKRECDTRYGRIPTARWVEWTNFLHDRDRFENNSEIGKVLKQNGLKKDAMVVTYCHRGARAAAALYALRSLGFKDVKNYIGSWHEWSARKRLPAERGNSSLLREEVAVAPKLR